MKPNPSDGSAHQLIDVQSSVRLLIEFQLVAVGDQEGPRDVQVPRCVRILQSGHLLAAAGLIPRDRYVIRVRVRAICGRNGQLIVEFSLAFA